MNDGAIDIHMAFDPAEAVVSVANPLPPPGARTFVMVKGTIGTTSFVAIPFNAAHKDAALVVADFLLEPATQARAQDPAWGGNTGANSWLIDHRLAPRWLANAAPRRTSL